MKRKASLLLVTVLTLSLLASCGSAASESPAASSEAAAASSEESVSAEETASSEEAAAQEESASSEEAVSQEESASSEEAAAQEESAEASEDGYPLTFTDALGREVTLSERPEKAAALIGSFASVWTLAGGSLCAATDDAFDDFDLGLTDDVANLGKVKEINQELLLASDPDLIIASVNTEIDVQLVDTFDQAGIPALYFDVNNFDSYLSMLETCTAITGRDDLYQTNGLDVKEQIENAVAKAQEALNGADGPTVLYLRATASSVKAKNSEGTVLGEMLSDLGCVNIADGSDLLENLSIETIITEDPEYIFIVEQGDDTAAIEGQLDELLLGNPAWAGLSAVQNEKVIYLDGHLYNLKPNDRWGLAYEQLEELLYG